MTNPNLGAQAEMADFDALPREAREAIANADLPVRAGDYVWMRGEVSPAMLAAIIKSEMVERNARRHGP